MDTESTVTGQQLDNSTLLQRDPTPYEQEALKREQQLASTESEQDLRAGDGSVVEGCETGQ